MALDLHLGADVLSSDGVKVGKLYRLVVDQDSKAVNAIVVKESKRFLGHLFAGVPVFEDELLIPAASISSAEREAVHLQQDAAAARRQRPYLSYLGDEQTEAGEGIAPKDLEIQVGENVMMGRSGRRLGTVRDVVTEQEDLVGIVVHPDGLFKEDVLLQVRFLDRSDDAALFAHITPDDLEHLEPFHPEN